MAEASAGGGEEVSECDVAVGIGGVACQPDHIFPNNAFF
jgi:hypothetical protein